MTKKGMEEYHKMWMCQGLQMVVYCFVVSGLLWMGHSIADRLDWATVPLVLCIYLFILMI